MSDRTHLVHLRHCSILTSAFWKLFTWSLEQKATEETERNLSVFSVFSADSLKIGARKDLAGYAIGPFKFMEVDDRISGISSSFL